jgi:hypothetical protein
MADEFEVKTHAELARIVASVKVARRNRPDHAWCSDRSACKWCAQIRDAHHLIDDHLDQLEGIDSPYEVEPLPNMTDARECGVCGRRRYVNFCGAMVCLLCDGYPAGSWIGMNGETVE